MKLKRCKYGHAYDADVDENCPWCRPNSKLSITPAAGVESFQIHTTPLENNINTVPIKAIKEGFDPLVGWLVCIEGVEKGKGYQIKTGKNYVGSSENMDICIKGDDTVSRKNHAVISFEDRRGIFRAYQTEGQNIVYLNGEEIPPSGFTLKAYDVLEIGVGKFVFVPFCGEKFKW